MDIQGTFKKTVEAEVPILPVGHGLVIKLIVH